jgi:hypothetical protein
LPGTFFVVYVFVEIQPIGIIGEPLGFGLNYYAVGIRKDIPINVVETMNYWFNVMMTCSPNDCGNASMAQLYSSNGGTGQECKYVAYPILGYDGLFTPGVVVGIVVGVVAFVLLVSTVIYKYKLGQQEQRYKKRFVQQIARNINIGPSPACIPVDKLAEQVSHIGDEHGVITKPDLLQWMLDVKLEFISNRDFDALWAAMDPDNQGEVNAIDFFVFLSACGNQFEQVYREQQSMSKTERLKWAARRLSNINKLGEKGIRQLELKLERGGRGGVASGSYTSSHGGGGGDEPRTAFLPNTTTIAYDDSSCFSFEQKNVKDDLPGRNSAISMESEKIENA